MVEFEIEFDARSLKWTVGLAAACLFLFLLFHTWIPRARYHAMETETKQNLHSIQLALERFAVDTEDQSYPRRLEELKERGYLPEFPPNPFEGRPMRGQAYDIRYARDFDANLAQVVDWTKGDFVYFRRYGEGAPDGPVMGYTLLAF